ncbi:MAG: flagellar hook-associated protein FlgK [Phycisphaerae bacterium]|nr:flagellar hook-associated protein FlgK [Phycisphaerae bacterium]
MSNFSIGLSGLNAAQTALDVIGNNVANAATEGYHRQKIELSPSTYGQSGSGVNVAGVTRMVDALLESEILRQQSSSGQVSQELSLLSTVETTLGEFTGSGGLNATIDTFFDSLASVAANPLEPVPRNDTISSAQALTSEFRRLGSSLKDMGDQIVLETQNVMDSINLLTTQIAELNGKIQSVEISQGQGGANNMCDQRDQLIGELSGLVGVETQQREHGIVDVSIAGIPVVTGSVVLSLAVGLDAGGTLAVSVGGADGSHLDVAGGQLGGLLALKNDLLGGVQTELDTLVKAIVDGVNRIHVQGLGQEGSFQELAGSSVAGTDLADLGGQVTDGTFYIRVTNTATGEVQRHAVEVKVSGATPDTLTSVAARIDSIGGLSASVSSARLCLVADQGYTFDFLPAALPEPTATSFTAASAPTVAVSGIYDGDKNHVFTFTAVGSGSVGNGSLRLDVRDDAGDLVGTVNVGDGYAAGDVIKLSNGLKIAVGMGGLNAGDSFQVAAFATTDTSGFLAAAGMNTFFSGASASEMRVCSDVLDSPDRIAAAFGPDLTDNTGAQQLVALRDEPMASLAGMTPGEYYQRTVANLGQEVALRQSRQKNAEAMLQNLQKQRSDLSSVNINDEAALLLVYQQMFQAAAKYLSTLQATMTTLMDMI